MSHRPHCHPEPHHLSERDLAIRTYLLQVYILEKLEGMENVMSENQDKLNIIAGRLGTLSTDLRADFQSLKDQIAAGTPPEELDFSAIDAKLDALDALDAETPAPETPTV